MLIHHTKAILILKRDVLKECRCHFFLTPSYNSFKTLCLLVSLLRCCSYYYYYYYYLLIHYTWSSLFLASLKLQSKSLFIPVSMDRIWWEVQWWHNLRSINELVKINRKFKRIASFSCFHQKKRIYMNKNGDSFCFFVSLKINKRIN